MPRYKLSFNKSARLKTIVGYNNTYKVDWTKVNKNMNYYIGKKVGERIIFY